MFAKWTEDAPTKPQTGLIMIEESVEGHHGLGIFGAELVHFGDSSHSAAPSPAGARIDDPYVADAEVSVLRRRHIIAKR